MPQEQAIKFVQQVEHDPAVSERSFWNTGRGDSKACLIPVYQIRTRYSILWNLQGMPLHYAHRLRLDMLGLIDFDSSDVSTKEQLEEKRTWETYAFTPKETNSTVFKLLHQFFGSSDTMEAALSSLRVLTANFEKRWGISHTLIQRL
jgi:hypothetical protein